MDDLDSGDEDEVEVPESKKPKLKPDAIESPDLKGADKECYDLMKSLQEQETKIASGQDEAKENFNVLEMDQLKCLHAGTSARPILNYVSDCFHSLSCCFNPCWESLCLEFTSTGGRNTQIYRKEFTDSKDPLVVAVGVGSDL